MLFNVKIISHASKNEVLEKKNDELQVKVTIAPEKGRANKKIIELLAEYFGVSKSDISIKKGEYNPLKIIEVRQK